MEWREFLFSIEGRASRGDFWLFFGISVGYGFGILLIFSLAGVWQAYAAHAEVLGFIVGLPLLWPTIAIGIRRLHDRNRNEDWILLFVGLPIISRLATTILDIGQWNIALLVWPIFVLQICSFVVSIWWLVEFGFLRGTMGDNPYGPDPVPSLEVALNAPGYSVKVTYNDNAATTKKQEFFYVAASNPEEARSVIREARGVSEDAIVILGPLLHETVQRLNLSPGQFVPAQRAT